jgi:FAD/FMN-containing dehydrogenase
MIRTEFGRFTRQVSGYSLEHLLPENGADLAKFLVGTEGTLAMVTGATVRLVQSPKAVALAVLGYPGMAEAADAVPALLPHRPVAMEGMNAQLVDVFRARRGAASVPGLPRGQAWCSSRPRVILPPRRTRRPAGSSPTPPPSTRWW